MTLDELYALTPAGDGRWRAPGVPRTDEQRLYGGLLIGHAIAAASAGTRRCHALHALFIGAGERGASFDVHVERTRDGGSFASRRVEVRQGEQLLLAGYTSHHDGDDGPAYQRAMPDVPAPESLEDQAVARSRKAEAAGRTAKRFLVNEMLDIRMVPDLADGLRAMWMRPRVAIPGAAVIHQAAIGFASDTALAMTGVQTVVAAGEARKLQVASLDHAIWLHREVSANDWLLHTRIAVSLAEGRGFSHGSVYTREGVLAASMAQEYLARAERK